MTTNELSHAVIGAAMRVQLKAVSALVARHEAQLVNYLTATGIDDGLLVNFGAPSLQFKHKYRRYSPASVPVPENPVNPVNPV